MCVEQGGRPGDPVRVGKGMTEAQSEKVEVSPPSGYLLCPGGVEDLDEMLPIEAESFTAPWTRKMFEGELRGNSFARFLLARASNEGRPGKVAAYLCYWIVFEELRLMNLAVAPHARRRGLGTWLVRQALEEARQTTGRRAVLEVRASNEAARALYRNLGFRETGRRRQYYVDPVEDAVLMALEPIKEVGER